MQGVASLLNALAVETIGPRTNVTCSFSLALRTATSVKVNRPMDDADAVTLPGRLGLRRESSDGIDFRASAGRLRRRHLSRTLVNNPSSSNVAGHILVGEARM